jgi:hypothetical protein
MPGRRDEMRGFWALSNLKAPDCVQFLFVGFSHAPVLPKMFEPRVGHESLDKAAFLVGVFEYAAVVGALSSSRVGRARQGI